jgi:Family of unknown function (DUF6345)/Bacterial Ig domain/FlgD Ig-like domain
MKIGKMVGLVFGVLAAFTGQVFCQTNLQFTAVHATDEGAIQLHWASNSNEVYEIDYADSLIDTNTGSITWNKLYDDYPSHGTNTFITDAGNYDTTPEIPHPKFSPMRLYRVALIETNTSPSNPMASVVSPTNGAPLSGNVTIQVSASSDEILSDVKLYIDGEEQWPSDDDSNFVINTCEWLNGNHTIFATAKSQSGLEGIPNGGTITYGRAVSSYVNVTVTNLISGFDFSQPFFEPALGETQQVTAIFAANCDWTLQIQDASSSTVRTATGSGNSMEFDWDGTGDGGTSIPDGVYTYLLSVQTNGEADEIVGGGSGGSGGSGPPSPDFVSSSPVGSDSSELWAMPIHSSGAAVPFAIYPPGFDTNDLIIFPASQSEIQDQSLSFSSNDSSETEDASPAYSGPSSQSTSGPTRKPKTGVKGTVGTFGILYKTYSLNGFNSPHPTTGWPPPLPTYVAIDNQGRTDHTVDYRILNFAIIADDFAAGMKRAGWKQQFRKADDQWSATDIKKSSLGGNSIFNTCNFGLLMTHGSFGNNSSTGTEDDNIKYTYCWLGANNYVRLSDMDFGSAGTNGLKWMTIYACSILASPNYDSMNAAGKIPVNENLHLLLGPSSYTYAFDGLGKHYAENLTIFTNTVVDAFNQAGIYEANYHSRWVTNNITHAVSGWPACFNDSLLFYNDPDPEDGLMYKQYTIYNLP